MNRTTERTRALVVAIIGLMATLGAVVHSAGVAGLEPLATPVAVPGWALAVAFFATGVYVCHITMRDETHTLTLVEVPVVIGLAFASPLGLIAGRMLGSGAALVLHRRLPTLKVAFNLSLAYLETVAAIAVYRALLDSASPTSGRGWIAGLVAMLTMQAISLGAVRLVIHLTAPAATALSAWSLAVSTGGTLGAAALGLTGVLMLWQSVAMVLAIVVAGAAMHLTMRALVRLRLRLAALEQVSGLSALLGGLDAAGIAGQILQRARAALNTETAELMITDTNGSLARFQISADGTVISIPLDPATFPDLLAYNGAASDSDLSEHGYRDGLVAAIPGPAGPIGRVSAFNRLGPRPHFDKGDADLLGDIASQVGLALR